MKFKNYLTQIENVEVFPLISLGLFVVFFLIVTIWVMRWDKSTVDEMGNLPLDKEDK